MRWFLFVFFVLFTNFLYGLSDSRREFTSHQLLAKFAICLKSRKQFLAQNFQQVLINRNRPRLQNRDQAGVTEAGDAAFFQNPENSIITAA